MNLLSDTILVFLLFSVFLLLGSSRLGACIRTVALQGVLTGLLPLARNTHAIAWRVAAMVILIIVLKGIVFPKLLFRALRESDTSREVQPYIGYGASIFAGVLAILGSFWLDARLALPTSSTGSLVAPVAFAMMITGLFLMVARKTAMNQVIGYLVLENGIYTFGAVLVHDVPMLTELGVLMDVFVAVFVMGIAINRINREFDHIDADLLTNLKG